MRAGDEGERKLVRHAIEHGGQGRSRGRGRRIHRVGALDYARERAREEAATAIPLWPLPDSACRDSLLQLDHFPSRESSRAKQKRGAFVPCFSASGCSLAW